MKKKVMHVIHHIGYGGAQRMFIDTACGLQKRGNTENVGCFILDMQELRDYIHSNTRMINVGLPRTDSYMLLGLMGLYEFPALLWTIYKEKPDIIYVYYSPAEQFFAAIGGKIFGKRVVVRKYDQRARQHVIFRFLNQMTYPFCDKIVSIFSSGVDELEKLGVPADKIERIPNGKTVKKDAPGRRKAKARLGLKETDFVVGAVSRIHPLKNYELAIEALPELLASDKNVKLVIVGDSPLGSYKEKLRQLIRTKGLEDNVVFLGGRKDVDDIYPAFDIFVHPSFSEGGPGAVLEAMCAGLPIIASNVGGTKDLLADDCGILISPDDRQELADALKRMMNDPELRNEYGRRAKARAEKEFSLETMLDRYEKLFEEL